MLTRQVARDTVMLARTIVQRFIVVLMSLERPKQWFIEAAISIS
jgi:hypothetical protein